MKNHSLLTVAFIVLLVSCTSQKSQYHPGYYGDLGGNRTEVVKPGQKAPTASGNSVAVNSQPFVLPAPAIKADIETPQNVEISPKIAALIPKKQPEKGLSKSTSLQNPEPPGNTVQASDMPPVQEPIQDENGDGFLYMTAALMALATLGLLRTNRSRVTKLTRWAKANPKKTQLLIAGIQLPLLALGVMSGHNIKEMGVEFSGTMPYLFGSLMALGFLSLPYGPNRSSIVLPKQVFRQRLAYLTIALSSLMMTVGIGNKIGEKYPTSPVTQIVKKMDQSAFSAADAPQIKADKNKASHAKHNSKNNFRKWVAAGTCALAVFLILLLIITTCSGICLTILGFVGLGSGEVALGVLGIIAGLAITWLSIKGIINVSKWCKKGSSDGG